MDFLRKYALQKIWCEPQNDYNHVFKPWRVSPQYGSGGVLTIGFYRVTLPMSSNTDQNRYHVYHIGKIDDSLLGLNLPRGQWVNLPGLMQANRALIDVYLGNGCMVPKAMCYLRILEDGSVVLAVQLTDCDFGTQKYILPDTVDTLASTNYDITTSDLYIRFIRNGRFDSAYWQATSGDSLTPIRQLCIRAGSQQNYSDFIAQKTIIINRFNGHGAGLFFNDGFIESAPSSYTAQYQGKFLSFTYDDTIKSVQFHKLTDLNVFNSTLDVGKNKYLVLSTQDYGKIDYEDDVDFYLVKVNPNGSYRGVFVDRMQDNAVRNVTHNAWAINVDYVNALIHQHDLFANLALVKVLVVVRQGGKSRGLVTQANRVEDLYRLPRDQILQALTGVNSSMPEWEAAALEASAYCTVMRSPFRDITDDLSFDALGYNSAIAMAEPVIHAVSNGVASVENALMIPDFAGNGARAVFVYDQNRRLIDYYSNNSLSTSELLPTGPMQDNGTMAEIFHGEIDELGDGAIYGAVATFTDARLGYWGFRAYVCPTVGGNPNEEWVDVTGNTAMYTMSLVAGVPRITWNTALLAAQHLYQAVKINGKIHVYKPEMPATEAEYDGILDFTISATVNWRGTVQNRQQSIPPAVVDIIMDGRSLIHGLDYYMDFPRVVICRRPVGLVSDTVVIVRTWGCPDPDTMKPYITREYGFVKSGLLSVDGTWNVRNDRSVRVNIGGSVYSRNEVAFAEDDNTMLVTDGLPYSVLDYITPIEPYAPDRDTVVERGISYALDNRVSAYLSQRLVEEPGTDNTVSFERWRVFSPFLNAVIYQMLNGNSFNDQYIDIRYGNVEVEAWIAPFKYLLDFDPAVQGFDPNYVVVYPHQYQQPVEVTSLQFGLLNYLIRNYLNGKVVLSQSVNIGVTP